MKITRDIPWAQLRNIPIDQVARALGSEPKRRGGNMYSCPVCGSSDALNINLRKSNNAVCYSSGCAEYASDAHGAQHSTIDLVMLSERLDIKDAARWLGERFGVEIDVPPTRIAYPPRPKAVRQKPTTTSSEANTAAALELAASIWRLVEHLELTRDAVAWLEGRSIDPQIAHALGCRDFHPVLEELASILNQASKEACQATGWRTREGKPHDPVRWSRKGMTGWCGLAVPSWLASDEAPRSWRWRLYSPMDTLKTYTLSKTSIGQRLPSGDQELADARTLVVCEGEPDWLSIYDAAHRLGLEEVGALGICSGKLEPQDIAHASPEHVILAIHQDVETEQKERASKQKRKEMLTTLKERFPSASISAPRVYGHHDLNDLHQEGLLTEWLAQGMEVCR
jgi:hypothetical protein